MVTRKVICSKCGSDKINITWKFKKSEEMNMLLCHDGYGLQLEDATIRCAECKSKKIEVK